MKARRPLAAVACIFAMLFVVACSEIPAPTVSPTLPVPSTSGIVVVDPRLMAPMRAIAANPEWAPGSVADLNAHLARSSGDELCVEVVRPNLLPLYVTLDIDSQPWEVKSIVVFDPATDREPTVTYQNDDPHGDPDNCRGVLNGSGEPFPFDPSAVEIVGGVRPEHSGLIAQALVAAPEAFGIDRSSLPSLNVRPLESADENVVCYAATVFQGGPRANVRITLRRDDAAAEWRFHYVRVIHDPYTPGSVPEGAC